MHFSWLFLLAVVQLVQGEEVSDAMKQCIKERRRGLVSIKKKIGICQATVSESAGSEKAIRGCLAKCVFKQENALDQTEAITPESIENAIKDRVSGGQRDLLLNSSKKCVEQHGTLVKPKDPSCPGYEAVGSCLQSAIESLCEDLAVVSSRAGADSVKEEL